MNKITTLVLFVLVLGLGVVVWKQTEKEEDTVYHNQEPLLLGIELGAIQEIFIDHVERDKQFAFTRTGGAWRISDPIDYPAERGMMNAVLKGLQLNATFVPAASVDDIAATFDPPRVKLTITDTTGGIEPRTTKLEIGGIDVDGMSMFVKVRGRYMRCLKPLDNALGQSIQDFRTKDIFTLRPNAIVEFQRSGFTYDQAGSTNIDLAAHRAGATWVMTRPHKVQVHPTFMMLYLAATAQLRAERFVNDLVDGEMSVWGLHNPHFSLTLTSSNGTSETVLFATAPNGQWFCKRDSDHYVFEVDNGHVEALAEAPSTFLDDRIVRAFQKDIRHIDLHDTERVVRLTQRAEEQWVVSSRPTDGDFDVPVPADVERVKGFFSAIEGTDDNPTISRYLLDAADAPQVHFPAGAARRGIWFELQGPLEGLTAGGRIGEVYTSSEGSVQRTFLRDDENRVALVSETLDDWITRSVDEWRALQVLELMEVQLASLRISAGDTERSFRREIQGTWKYIDMDARATELEPLLDYIFFLRARSHVAPEAKEELLEPVRIVVEGDQVQQVITVGRVASGEVQFEVLGMRSVADHQALHADLLELVGRKR